MGILERLPISDYVKAYYHDNNVALTDFACANIIWNSELPWQEKLSMLQELADHTADEPLKQQIGVRIAFERREYADFLKNDGTHIYCVGEYEDGSDQCFFTCFDKAIRWGKEHCEDVVWVEKLRVDPTEDAYNEILGMCYIDKENETVLSFRSYACNEELKQPFNAPDRFEDAFLPLMLPFERGDIVRDISTGTVGVVATSRQGWDELLDRIRNGRWCGDYSDMIVSVEYFDAEGTPEFDHCELLYLEKIDGCDNQAEWDLLTCMSRIMRGEDELLCNLFYYREQYVQSMDYSKGGGFMTSTV